MELWLANSIHVPSKHVSKLSTFPITNYCHYNPSAALYVLCLLYCKPPNFCDTKCLRFSNLDRFATYYICNFEFYHLYVRVLVHDHSGKCEFANVNVTILGGLQYLPDELEDEKAFVIEGEGICRQLGIQM